MKKNFLNLMILLCVSIILILGLVKLSPALGENEVIEITITGKEYERYYSDDGIEYEYRVSDSDGNWYRFRASFIDSKNKKIFRTISKGKKYRFEMYESLDGNPYPSITNPVLL